MNKSIAIIGASANREKYGNKAVRAYQKADWQVYPVNHHREEIEGLPVYRSILDIPDEIERVSMYLPPNIGESVIYEIAKRNPKEVYLNPGSESDDLLKKAKELGLSPVLACSIVAIGEDPSDYP